MKAYLLSTPTPPFTPAPREWSGNMCGVRVPGLPPVAGGADDPSLVLSWFYDRYSPADCARIRSAWAARGYHDVLLSWPDSRAIGATPASFAATCHELIAAGFRPCPMLCSKDVDAPDVPAILASVGALLPLIVGVVPRVCIGWELSLWLTPTQVQQLIDAIAPPFVAAGARVYVHFQQKYMAFQQPGGFISDFWNANVGKLTGVLAQRDQYANDHDTLDWINDCLERCAGRFNMPAVIIDSHPVDFIALELTALEQFAGSMTEADGNRVGQLCINAPAVSGPAGTVRVMGSGNGS